MTGKDIIDWAYDWNEINGDDVEGFSCPKCREIEDNAEQYPFCRCEDMPKGHFHFECAACKFDAIMRTADDEENKSDDDNDDNDNDEED